MIYQLFHIVLRVLQQKPVQSCEILHLIRHIGRSLIQRSLKIRQSFFLQPKLQFPDHVPISVCTKLILALLTQVFSALHIILKKF